VLAFAAGARLSVVGFIVCRVAADEAEILTLATNPRHRRRGVARALLETVTREADARGVASLFLEVAADNAAALALYTKAGFVAVGVRRGYYPRGVAAFDAVIMRRDLNR
nr:ribosomal protein S18-alanine N-acetyltransferase [Pseudomonadota bacterium]